jgi:hypothetical protein
MSWNINGFVIKAGEDVDQVISKQPVIGQDDLAGERDAAVSVASIAAANLIESGVYGDPETTHFRVAINGHVNPLNKPRLGWTGDSVYISISQTRAEVDGTPIV